MATAAKIGKDSLAVPFPPGAVAPKEGAARPDEPGGQGYGPNNEQLEKQKPRLVGALRDLVIQFRTEGIVARRHEIRRIKQARLFWQGLQYGWWSPSDMSWHLPFGSSGVGTDVDRALEEMPRYQFVTNFYQGFGLTFVALVSQDVPSTRFYPQSAQSEEDISAAKAASEAAKLIEQNNKVQNLLTGLGYYLWTDGKIGGYVPMGSGLASTTAIRWNSAWASWARMFAFARIAALRRRRQGLGPKACRVARWRFLAPLGMTARE